MKLRIYLPLITLVTFVCTASSPADLIIHYDFVSGAAVPDGFGQLSEVKTLGGLSGLTSIDHVVTRLNLTTGNTNNPMYLGDLYSSLTFGTSEETQSIAVLLNRPGRDNTNAFGSELSSLNVTLDDSASGTNVWSATSGTGTYNSDGRLGVSPSAPGVVFSGGSNSLTALEGGTFLSNRVSLIVADFSGGGSATLSGWGVSVSGTAAGSGTFAPGANASISDTGPGTTTVGATLDTSGASGGSLTVNVDGTMTFSNGVTGSGGLLKTGTGTLVLVGSSNYSGTTTINDGILAVNGTLGSGSAVTVNSGGTLGGAGTVSSSVTVKSGGIVGPGNSPEVLTTGASVFETNSIFAWDLASNLDHDVDAPTDETTGIRGADYDGLTASSLTVAAGAIFRVVLGGTANLANSFWIKNQSWENIFSVSGSTSPANGSSLFDTVRIYNGAEDITGTVTNGSFSFSGSTLNWTVVPEPTSALAAVLLGAGLMRRRRVA